MGLRLRNNAGRVLAIALLATAAAALCWRLGWLQAAERSTYDQGLTTFTGGRPRSSQLVVVAIDQTSVGLIRANPTYALNFGSYPWSRTLWARVLEQLHREGARAVVFDAVMDERSTDPSSDLALAQTLRDTGLPFYLGFSADADAPALPHVDAVNGLPATRGAAPGAQQAALSAGVAAPPAQAASGDGAEDFEEAPAEALAPAADPLAAARALAFPVRVEGRTLPLLDYALGGGQRAARHPTPPISPLLDAVAGFGLVETEADPDARVRRTRFAYTDGVNSYVTLPVAVAADLFGAKALELTPGRMRLGAREWAVDADGSAELDYGGRLEERAPVVPLVSVLDAWALGQEGKPTGLAPGLFRDKVVVIGGFAVGLGDVKATPFAPDAPGVSKHVAVLDNLLGDGFITLAPAWVSLLLALGVALVSATLLTVVRSTLLEIAWPLALFFGFFLLTGLTLRLTHLHVLGALPTLSGELASIAAVAFNHLFANRERDRMRTMFSRYLARSVVDQLVEQKELPRLTGESLEVSAFFSDIRGFSTFSERFKDDPAALVRILNTYLTRVTDALLAHGACLDKYIGDAVVCLFGAPLRQPDHALRACRGALAVRDAVERLREEFRRDGLPDVYTRIGVNTAVMFVGNIGSEQLFDYTAIGDGMNLAARLEAANKAYGSSILIGPETYAQAKEHIEARELDRVRVAGKTEAVSVYELLALRGDPRVTEAKRRTLARYAEALALYRAARFEEAAQVLEAALGHDAEDSPSRALLARCRHYAAEPPPLPFDGVVSLEK
nr:MULTISPECIES: adenylate/guanylate cyclase domain-containing protein [Myxococcaceae]